MSGRLPSSTGLAVAVACSDGSAPGSKVFPGLPTQGGPGWFCLQVSQKPTPLLSPLRSVSAVNRCVSRPGSSRSSRLPAHFGLQQATNQRLHAAARSAAERSALPQRQKLFRVKARDVSCVLNFLYFQTQLVKLIVNRSAEHLCLPFTQYRDHLRSGASSVDASSGRPSHLSQPT